MAQRLIALKARVVSLNNISCVIALKFIKIKITLNFYKTKIKIKINTVRNGLMLDKMAD